MKNPILDHISSLMCINCGSNDWNVEKERLSCKACSHHYSTKGNQLITVNNHIKEQNWDKVSDGFDLFKGNERPIMVDKLGGPRIKDLRKNLMVKGIAVNLGSGHDNHEGFINMDLGDYDPVHIIADLKKVPLMDGSVELIVSNSVLEHIYDYNAVIDEAFRILGEGGYFYLCVPTGNCVRHHKFDFHRWTTPGLHKLFEKRFEIIQNGACRGVAYALVFHVEALLTYKIKNKTLLSVGRWLWRLISRPLFWIKDEANEEYQALSHTIYVLAKKI